jgi:hypothetical protein
MSCLTFGGVEKYAFLQFFSSKCKMTVHLFEHAQWIHFVNINRY